MEKFQALRDAAKKRLQIADHMLTMTYPFVQDPKLLVAVLENVFLSLTNAMNSVLHYERTFKRVPLFQETFASRMSLFKEKCIERYDIDEEYLRLMEEIRSIIIEHKKSPVEFSRKDKFVICSRDYQMKAISLDIIKSYIFKTKNFVNIAEEITSKNESIFR